MLHLAQSLMIPFGIAVGFAGLMRAARGRAAGAFGIAAAYLIADIMLRGLPSLTATSALALTVWTGLIAGIAAILIEQDAGRRGLFVAAGLISATIALGFPFSAGALALPANEGMLRMMMALLTLTLLLQAGGIFTPPWAEARAPSFLVIAIGLATLAVIAHLYGSRISLHAAIVLAALLGHRVTALLGYGPPWSRGSHFVAASLFCALSAGLFFARIHLIGPVGLMLIAQALPDALRQFPLTSDPRIERIMAPLLVIALSLAAIRLM